MALWPRLRIPLWAAILVPVAAYTVRSVARGSTRPDLPMDAIVLAAWLLVLLVAALYGSAAQRRRDDLDAETGETDTDEGHRRQDE